MDIVDTRIQILNRLNFNQWKLLRTLFIQNNDFLNACHEERTRLLNESRHVSLTMPCIEKSTSTESHTSFPSIANSTTTETYTSFSNILDNVTTSTK